MRFLNPLQRVRGLGSAKSGTEEWWHQRVTSVALVPLSVFLVVLIVSLIGADHAAVVERVGHPVIAVCLILALGAVARHMQLGMKVIIEDYVHYPAWKAIALIGNAFFAVAIAVAGAFAVLTLSLGA